MATPVTSYGPLEDRIYEALTTDTSQPRKLATGYRFKPGLPPVQSLISERAIWAKEALSASCLGTCFVLLGEQRVTDGDPYELGSAHVYRITIRISRDYYLGWAMTSAKPRLISGTETGINEVRTAIRRCLDHFPLIRAALCYPGAHATTAAGASTGLCTDSLIGASAQAGAPTMEIVDNGQGRLLSVTDTFLADVEWNPGS